MRGALLAAAIVAFLALPARAQDARTPTDAVDAFHRALTLGNTAAALSLLARDLIEFEFGMSIRRWSSTPSHTCHST
jgi:hypothetical protein